jgi:pSer/pThr/pTyr-binding forkhead associated (FHA) protein
MDGALDPLTSAYLELPDGRRMALDKDKVLVGRGAANDLVLTDAKISRRHAQLQRLPHGWLLIDLNAANGTWVNGDQIVGPYLLQDQDVIQLGEQRVVYRVAESAPSPPAARRRMPLETVLGRSAFGAPEVTPPPRDETTTEFPTGEHPIGDSTTIR